MYQILFHLPDWLPLIGGMPVYGYGVMMVIGFFGAIQLGKVLARHSGIDPEVFVNAGLIALVTGVLGARASHVLENLGDYTRSSTAVAAATDLTPDPRPTKAEEDDQYTLYGPRDAVIGRFQLAKDERVGFRREDGALVAIAGNQTIRMPDTEGHWERHVGAWENFINAVNIRSGGLTYYGGLLLATPCTIAYGLMRRVPIRIGMDIVAPCIMIGLGLGRVGCFLNGCCYGAEANPHQVPWAMKFPYDSNPYIDEFDKHKIEVPERLLVPTTNGRVMPMTPADIKSSLPLDRAELQNLAAGQHSLPLHPAQLYSTITALMIAALLVACYTLPHVPGRIFALMLLLEAPTRYILEMLRQEPAVIGHAPDPARPSHLLPLSFLPPQSFSMVLSVVLFVVGVVLWFAFRGPKIVPGEPEEADRDSDTPVVRRPAVA